MASYETEREGRAGGGARYLPKGESEIWFPRDRTALLVIDPVNDFLSEGGAGWEATKLTVQMNDVIMHLKQAIEGARQRGFQVIFGPMAYVEEDYAEERLQCRSGINRFMFEKKMFLAGSWGADIHPDLQPAEGDIVLMPHKGMDVFETDLPEHLERLGISHLVIAGMTANFCCESTGRHAMEAGFDVTFLSDAIGASSFLAYEASIHVNYPFIANAVLTVAEFLGATERTAGDNAVRPGDMVRGSDHGEIGHVEKVVAATEVADGYLLVPRGMIFLTDTYVPLESVVKRSGRDVFINIPKALVVEMPWGAPPSRTDRKARQAPPAAAVEKLYGSRTPMSPRKGGGLPQP